MTIEIEVPHFSSDVDNTRGESTKRLPFKGCNFRGLPSSLNSISPKPQSFTTSQPTPNATEPYTVENKSHLEDLESHFRTVVAFPDPLTGGESAGQRGKIPSPYLISTVVEASLKRRHTAQNLLVPFYPLLRYGNHLPHPKTSTGKSPGRQHREHHCVGLSASVTRHK